MKSKRELTLEILGGCFLAIVVIIIAALLYAAIGMWIWNVTLVPLFDAPIIGYWQMYGVMVLGRMIFGRSLYSSSKD